MALEVHIKYQGKGFWIPEAFIEILSQFICETFESNVVNTYSENLRDIYDDCDGNRSGEARGMVNILFNESIISSSDKTAIIDVLEQTKSLISTYGDEISTSTLNEFENNKPEYFRSSWDIPIKTSSLIGTLNIMQDMINGTWTSDNYAVNFIGYPHISGQDTI